MPYLMAQCKGKQAWSGKGAAMSSELKIVELVKQHFAMFGQGNIHAALEMLSDDVDFQSPVSRNAPPEISWARPRRGREQVMDFFRELLEKVVLERMELGQFTVQGDRVVVEGINRGMVRATGRTYEHDWIMVFTIRGDKIVRHRHYYDTADLAVAFRPQ
jgi:ketosteroid isomerase-like protein